MPSNKLKILCLTATATAILLGSGCMTIKESHVHIHDSDKAAVFIIIKGSDAQDSLNGNEPKFTLPIIVRNNTLSNSKLD